MKQKRRTPALLADMLLLASAVMIFGGCGLIPESNGENIGQNRNANETIPPELPEVDAELSDVKQSYDIHNVSAAISFAFFRRYQETQPVSFPDLSDLTVVFLQKNGDEILIRTEPGKISSEEYSCVFSNEKTVFQHKEIIRIPEELFCVEKGGEIRVMAKATGGTPICLVVPYEKSGDEIRLLQEYSYEMLGSHTQGEREKQNRYCEYHASIGLSEDEVIW